MAGRSKTPADAGQHANNSTCISQGFELSLPQFLTILSETWWQSGCKCAWQVYQLDFEIGGHFEGFKSPKPSCDMNFWRVWALTATVFNLFVWNLVTQTILVCLTSVLGWFLNSRSFWRVWGPKTLSRHDFWRVWALTTTVFNLSVWNLVKMSIFICLTTFVHEVLPQEGILNVLCWLEGQKTLSRGKFGPLLRALATIIFIRASWNFFCSIAQTKNSIWYFVNIILIWYLHCQNWNNLKF